MNKISFLLSFGRIRISDIGKYQWLPFPRKCRKVFTTQDSNKNEFHFQVMAWFIVLMWIILIPDNHSIQPIRDTLNLTHYQTTKLWLFQFERIYRWQIFKIITNLLIFSYMVEKQCHYEQFFLFPQCFPKTFTTDT